MTHHNPFHGWLALIRKDLLLFLGNRRALLLMVAAPVLIAAFFGTLFGADARVSQVPVAITDLDNSPLTQRIVAALQAEPALRLQVLPEAEASAEVLAGRVKAAITLPVGFGREAPLAALGAADPPQIVVQHDPSQNTVLPLVRGLLAQQAAQPVMAAVMQKAMGAMGATGMAGAVPGAAFADRPGMAPAVPPTPRVTPGAPFTTREVEAIGAASQRREAGRGYNSYAHAFAGMGVQFILLQGVEVGVALLLMRRSGLWLRLRAAPVSKPQLLGSRLLSFALIAAGVFAALWAVAIVGFGVQVLGSALGLVAVVASFALMSAAFGLMIAALGRSPEATRGLAILATLLLVMVGGAWVPTFLFPPWLQSVSAWTPTHWAVSGMDAMTWRAQPWEAALAPSAALLGFAGLFAAVALAVFRWEE